MADLALDLPLRPLDAHISLIAKYLLDCPLVLCHFLCPFVRGASPAPSSAAFGSGRTEAALWCRFNASNSLKKIQILFPAHTKAR